MRGKLFLKSAMFAVFMIEDNTILDLILNPNAQSVPASVLLRWPQWQVVASH
jgi:hypothetical protein